MSYYGYIERENSTALDWQTIGKELSDGLLKAGKDRQDRRDEIEQDSIDYQKTLDEAPSGDYKTANTFALNHATDASRARLIQDRLFKNGIMSDRQYTVARQNLRDDTNSLFGLSKEYQKEYDSKMVRFKNNESQVLESMLMENIEGLANLSNAGTFINMESGQVSIGTYKGEGDERKLSSSPDDVMTVNQMRNRYKQQYDKFDLSGTMTLEAERTAAYTTALRTAGGENYVGTIESLLDPTQRGRDASGALTDAISDFEKFEKEMIDGYLGNEYQALSILTNSLVFDKDKNTYFPTLDPYLKGVVQDGKNYVLVKDNGSGTVTVDMTKDQAEATFKTAQTNFRNKLDYKETTQVYTEPKPTPPNAVSTKINQTQKSEEVGVSSWNTLAFGTKSQRKTAVTNLLNSKGAKGVKSDGSDRIMAIDITQPGAINVIYKDSSLNQIIKYDADITIEDWAKLGNVVHGVDDVTTVMSRSGGTPPSGYVMALGANDLVDVFAHTTGKGKVESNATAFNRIINNIFDTSTETSALIANGSITPDGKTYNDAVPTYTNDKFSDKYTDKLPNGFKMQTVDGYTDATKGRLIKIVYKSKNGTQYSEEIDITRQGHLEKIRDYISKQSQGEEAMVSQATFVSANGGKKNLETTYTPASKTQGVGGRFN